MRRVRLGSCAACARALRVRVDSPVVQRAERNDLCVGDVLIEHLSIRQSAITRPRPQMRH
jgi:hypothetical protein